MKGLLIASSSLGALALTAVPAAARTPADDAPAAAPAAASPRPADPQAAGSDAQDRQSATEQTGEIIVTATRRSESLQDVPLSVTAFSQEQLTRKGIVGYEGLARETPGIVVNKASANFNNFTARGISTNGYSAGLQTTVAIYLDDLPLSTIGNTVTLNPNLFDVQRVEFLRGPQGTLFGSGSLSGALRIITKSPELDRFDASALVDIGETPDGGGVRQRYNAMVNVPLVEDRLALRVVGYYRHEDGWVDNIGTGVKNANTLVDWGGRATLLWRATDRLDIKLLASYEDSNPKDSSLSNPLLGKRIRTSARPDVFSTKLAAYNATIDYQFDGAKLTSSTTYSYDPGKFYVDLAGTFDTPTTPLPIPFFLIDDADYKTFVEETRIVSDPGGKFDWVVGGYYLHRELDLHGKEQSTPEYLAAHGLTGLPADATFYQFGSNSRSYELAGFGELTYHFSDRFWATGGLRYGKYGTKIETYPGFNSNYLTSAYYIAHFGIALPLTITDIVPAQVKYPSASKASWKASLSFKPTPNLTTYATVSTGYRTPVYNARAGSVSTVDPDDIIIPAGAGSDKLTNYEIGLKGHWLDGKLAANLAAYYIDWRNIQVQANRPSDAIQFATNVGHATSKGIEFEISALPFRGFSLRVNGSWGRAKIVSLTDSEALISGAVDDARLAAPHFQGSATAGYSYDLPSGAKGYTSLSIQHVGAYPNMFPNTPGTGLPNPLFDYTDSYENINAQTGVSIGKFAFTVYVENLANSQKVTYIHPENFIYNRYLRMRPRTFGVRVGWNIW